MALACGCCWEPAEEDETGPVHWDRALGAVRCHACGRIYSLPSEESQPLEERLARAEREQSWAFDQAAALCAEVERLQHQLTEALKGRLLVPLIDVERDVCRMSTRVTVDLPYRDFDMCEDRREFRQRLSRLLKGLGDTFMAAWERLHEAEDRQ